MTYKERFLLTIAGLFIVLFLFEHLLTNSQAALFFGDDGIGFVRSVNFIHSLPYLPVIEVLFLLIPITIHGYLGIQRIRTSKINSFPGEYNHPVLWKFARNHAYTWQRIFGILLVVGITLHVWFMRFHNNPIESYVQGDRSYFVTVHEDEGLQSVANRLHATILRKNDINVRRDSKVRELITQLPNDNKTVLLSCNTIGTAFLFVVRDTFKSVILSILYSFFVVIASFHAAQGIWSSSIVLGIAKNELSQKMIRSFANAIFSVLVVLGLACIWGTYWINLRS